MNAVTLAEGVSQSARRMISFLLSTSHVQGVLPAPTSLPAGSMYLANTKLIVGATACGRGVYNPAMWNVAMETGADIILAHQTRYPAPDVVDRVSFSVLIHIDGVPRLFEQMVLFWAPAVGSWLLPFEAGTYISLDPRGPLTSSRAPYRDWWERDAGVEAAAEKIIQATRGREVC
jgi:hypothetical protein